MNSFDTLRHQLLEVDCQYRSAPFWGWNDTLKKDRLEFQLQEMKRQKMGGFFIHSREGLETPYLSKDWMEAVKFVVQKAKEEGMEVWIYDEDKWPSGSAGGEVSKKNPKEFTAKGITCEIREGVKNIEIERLGEKDKAGETINEEKIIGIYPFEKDKIMILRMERSKGSEWYNHLAPTDNLNPDAVKEFCTLTHEKYRQLFSEHFENTIKGFFTDEPNFYDFFSRFTEGRAWLPWSLNFEKIFLETRGYDPIPYLSLLFVDEGEQSGQVSATKLRHDYWRTLTERFSESYMKQLYDWCDQNRIMSTGHMLYENDLGYQVRVCGAAMPHYRYLHCPGIDILGDQISEYLTVKQCTSVAHQYSRKVTFSETYGCTGWDFTFEGQKYLGDWQFVMGITRRCQHLALYSITGCRKRDYPPVFQYQTTWWEHNYYLEDYFARLSAALSCGEVIRKILVLHPIFSIWTQCRSKIGENLNDIEMNMGWKEEQFVSLNRWGEELNRFAHMLLSCHKDFDFGDEIILSEEGFIEESKFCVKDAKYEVVIIPKVLSLFESTYRLLEEFSANGGKIIWITPYPDFLEGEKNERTDSYIAKIEKGRQFYASDSYEGVLPLLEKTVSNNHNYRIINEKYLEEHNLLSMLRKTREGYLLFLFNCDRLQSSTTKIEVSFRGRVSKIDLMTGKEAIIRCEKNKNGMQFINKLSAGCSSLFLIETDLLADYGKLPMSYQHPHATKKLFAALGPSARFKRNMENVLILDTCCFRIGQEEYSESMQVWEAQKEIRERVKMQQVYYNGAPQRYTWIHKPEKAKRVVPFSLKFTVVVKEEVQRKSYLVIEKPQGLKVYCNGILCIPTKEWFLDQDMIKIMMPDLKCGRHEIVVEGIYQKEMELEDIYLIGEFGVNTEREIIAEKERIHFGDWTLQGYFHYPGSISYLFEVPKYEGENRIILHPGEFHATLLKVKINQKEVGIILNRQQSLDITEYMYFEMNEVEIEVVGSPRNMFGPFHQKDTGCSRISWEDFRTQNQYFTKEYIVRPYGLMGQFMISEERYGD